MRARAGRSARARAPYRRGTAVLDVCIESALQRFRRADVQRATPAGRSSCRRLGGIVEFFYVQVLGTLAAVLFFALPVLAMLPACSTSLRGFSLSLAGFVVGLLVFLVCVVVSLAHTKRGEGPAAFGIGFHLLAVGAIFFASWAIRFVVVVVGAALSGSSAAKRPSSRRPVKEGSADPPLHLAAWSGDVERARSLVRGGPRSTKETPLEKPRSIVPLNGGTPRWSDT